MGLEDTGRRFAQLGTQCQRLVGQRLVVKALPVAALLLLTANAPAGAVMSLTEQLHTPQEDTIRTQRDVADQFLLMGKEHVDLGNYEEAIVALQEAADAYHYLGDLVGMGESFEQLVKVYTDLGRYDDAERIVRQQLAIANSNQNFSDQILALNNLGTIRLQEGDLETAQAAFLEGLTISQDVESDSGIGLSLSNLGLIAAAQGQANDARKYYEVALEYRARARDYVGQANTDSNLGDAYFALGRTREAIGAYRVSLSMARDLDDVYLQLRALDGLIAIYRDRDEPRELSRYLNERIDLTVRTGDDEQRLITLKTLGEIYEERGELAQAHEAFSQALTLARALDRKTIQGELSNRIARLASVLDR
ncbi:MAG: tetratricopeptide repeat protein [Cyanobacteria bacterium J06627_28]